MAGGKTPMSNIVMSTVVLLALLWITPLFKYTPNATISSIIISAALGLFDFESAYLIWKVDKLDFMACLGAFLGVIFSSVEYGLLIAVWISDCFCQVAYSRTPCTIDKWLMIVALVCGIGCNITNQSSAPCNTAKDSFTWQPSKNDYL